MPTPTKPIYVHYIDSGEAVVYNLTEDQYNKICEDEDPTDLLEKFELPLSNFGNGYTQDFVLKLAELYGFEVGTN